MAEYYAVVQWTSAKVTSMGIIAESECQKGEFEVGSQIQAKYRSSIYEAKILFIGDLDSMSEKLASLKCSYKSSSSDSPRGRGHRMVKKKVLEDFVQPADDNLPKDKEAREAKSSSKTKNSLKRKASDDTGDAIIAKLLRQSSESLGDETSDVSEDELVEELDIEFEESQLVATLRAEVSSSKDEIRRLQRTIEELQEQNNLLQKGLPDLAVQLKAAISSLGKISSRPLPATLPATPSKPTTSKTPKTPVPSFCSPPTLLSGHDSSVLSENKENNFIIDEDILRRAGNAKAWGALVCNLMSAMFKRDEMANACLSEKQAAKTGKNVLPLEKVDAIIRHVLKTHSNADVPSIRIKMSTKLRDERNAFTS